MILNQAVSSPFLKPSVTSHYTMNKIQALACKMSPGSVCPLPTSPSSACVSVPGSLRSSYAGGLRVAQAGEVVCSFRTFAPSLHVVGPLYPQVTTIMSLPQGGLPEHLCPRYSLPGPCTLTPCLSGQVILCLLLFTSLFSASLAER